MSEQILMLLIKYENTLADLYSVCASTFPIHAHFWNNLSKEEEKHAQIIERLCHSINGSTVYLEKDRFKVRPVEISIEYAEELILRAKQGNLSLLEALSISNSIETSVIETYYYTIFGGKSSNLNSYFKQLKDESKVHRDKLQELLEKERKNKF
ncbi:MAG: hypothetical protein K0B84_09610 [Firmicutes bacterium]|nr:hypothetical protein [Bacillota bacterium]